MDVFRYDIELQKSKDVAEVMAEKLAGIAGTDATIGRLHHGHVVEKPIYLSSQWPWAFNSRWCVGLNSLK